MKELTVNLPQNRKKDWKRGWLVKHNPKFGNPRGKKKSLKVAFVILVTSSEYY